MSVKSASGLRNISVVSVSEPSASLKVLAVGDSDEWIKEGKFAPLDGVEFIAFHAIDEEALARLRPSLVYSPLLATTFDCIDLALLLYKLGYDGRYRALSTNVPKPHVIEREVRQLCPKLDFKIVDQI